MSSEDGDDENAEFDYEVGFIDQTRLKTNNTRRPYTARTLANKEIKRVSFISVSTWPTQKIFFFVI